MSISQAAETAISFDSFRVASNIFIAYQNASLDLPPSYYDCPSWCPEKREKCEDFCNQCPVKAQEDEMKSELEESLDERVGEHWRKWGIDNLLKHVYEVSYLAEGNPDNWTVTTARLVNIYKGQQNRIKRIEDYNREQSRKQKTR